MQKDPSNFKFPWIDNHKIWETADAFRTDYWPTGKLPVDVEKIAEIRLKLDIEPQHGLYADYDIEAWLKMDLTGIVVDHRRYMDETFANRLRFSYAHELGHLILHKDLYTNLQIETLEDWMRFVDDLPETEYKRIEYQANEFAGRLLVPRAVLMTELERCWEQIKKADLLEYLVSDPSGVLSSITPALRKPFGVSDDVIEKRVHREGLWPPKVGFQFGSSAHSRVG
jgi:hypothetical protein